MSTKPKVTNEYKRLSESPLWDWQRDFFLRHGAEVWKKNIVPNYITSNPFIAKAYAEIVLAYLKDITPTLTKDMPIYILEIGAGSGKFSFHFLRHFYSHYKNQNTYPVYYVMTEVATSMFDFWKSHHQLKPFIEEGLLDFGLFDISSSYSIKLEVSQKVINKDNQANIISIANYIFDCFPQDIFEVKEGNLFEHLVKLKSIKNLPKLGETATLTDDEIKALASVELEYEIKPCQTNYYDDLVLNNLLDLYVKNLNNTLFLFPTGAFKFLERLKSFSNGRLLVLLGDKGEHLLEALQENKKVRLANFGGCFTLPVNFHAIANYVVETKGQVLQTPHQMPKIDVLALLYGENTFEKTHLAYEQNITKFSPNDFFALKKATEKTYQVLDLGQILALLRLSHFDSAIFLTCYQSLIPMLGEGTALEKAQFLDVINKIWDERYILKSDEDLAFSLATLLAIMKFYSEAISFYKLSQKLSENSAMTEFNLGLCYFHIEEWEQAKEHMKKALGLDPTLPDPPEFLEKIDSLINK